MKKFLAVLLALVSLLSVFSGCAGESAQSDEIVLPEQVVEETYENRQKAIIETAWAYYYKNPYVQYGNDALTVSGSKLGNRGAEWMNNTPEMAGPQRSIFLVCSRYCYGATYHSFDIPLFDTWTNCSAVRLGQARISTLQPYVVWTYTSTGDEAEDLKAMEEFLATLQPGDIFAYERKDGTGHSGIWLGD